MKIAPNQYTHVKKVIGVVSGKGGVGKSMVTASLARLMREQGYFLVRLCIRNKNLSVLKITVAMYNPSATNR